jgi:hypothetical protein
MEGLFGYKDVIRLLFKDYLFGPDGLSLALTCKTLYGLVSPIMRLQMRAGMNFYNPRPFKAPFNPPKYKGPLPLGWYRCSACECPLKGIRSVARHEKFKCLATKKRHLVEDRCEKCAEPLYQHPLCHDDVCPCEIVTCKGLGNCQDKAQMLTPWLFGKSLIGDGIACAQCNRRLANSANIGSSACAKCGIYCFGCYLRTCQGCRQEHRDQNHLCAAYIDRLAAELRSFNRDSRCWEYTYFTHMYIESETEITAQSNKLQHMTWVLVPDRAHIPSIEYRRTGLLFIVHQETTQCIIHYDGRAGVVGLFQDHADREIKEAYPVCWSCFSTSQGARVKCKKCPGNYCSQACMDTDQKRHAAICV